jgi:4-phytase/acid phosphatase
MKSLRVAAVFFAMTGPFQFAAAQTNAAAQLERVVIVERHGVRPPTKAPEELAKFAEQAWPQWSVKPGELTAHGAQAIALMGGALQRYYEKKGLVGAAPCPAGVFVWSDSADQRTRASGDAVLHGMGCTTPSAHRDAGQEDTLFDPIAAGVCSAAGAEAIAATEKRLSTVLSANRARYDQARKTMQAILTPGGCGKDGQRLCLIGDGTDTVVVKNGEARLEGPLSNASGLTENLLLEYSEGMPLSEVGWGRAAGKLDSVLTLHNLYADVIRRNPVFAARRGSLLAQQVLDLLNGKQSSFQGAAPVPSDAKLVVFLGHDTNLSNMSGFVDTAWSLPGQPDHTAPGAAIAFELWRKADGAKVVTVRVFYQTLEETRALTPIQTPHSVTLPVCAGGQCSLDALTAKFAKTIASDCLKH